MAFLAKLFLISSMFSWFCFSVAELGLNGIPVMYPIGVFLHEYWFADYGERMKRNYGNFAIDGPPLVATPGNLATINYPYVSYYDNGTEDQVPFTYDDALKTKEKYTPVNGLFGVTKNYIRNSPTTLEQCYPDAQEPNEYITHRLLGDDKLGYQELKNLHEKNEIGYNTKVFKKGTPFKAAVIGGNKPNDSRWATMSSYQAPWAPESLLIPLTTMDTGAIITNQQVMYQSNTRDYSGAEEVEANTLETEAMKDGSARPYWYHQDQYGNLSENKQYTTVFPGEIPAVQPGSNLYDSNMAYMPLPEFTTPKYHQPVLGGSNGYVRGPGEGVGWGETNTQPSPGPGFPTNATQQLDYIQSQLSQDNPIPVKV